MDFQKLYEQYQENGCIKIENFLSESEVETLRRGLAEAMKDMTGDIHAHSAYSDPKTKDDEDYYSGSADKVAYFYEADAFDSEGNMIVEKERALNTIGYALHWWNPYFKEISFSQKVKDLLKHFEYKDPVICESVVIFKHPQIGVEYGIYQRCTRNFENEPFMVVKGKIPEYEDEECVPIPAKPGDCIVLHGSVVHKSARNNTDKSHTLYTCHVVEKDSEWSKENRIQPTEMLSFPSIYSN